GLASHSERPAEPREHAEGREAVVAVDAADEGEEDAYSFLYPGPVGSRTVPHDEAGEEVAAVIGGVDSFFGEAGVFLVARVADVESERPLQHGGVADGGPLQREEQERAVPVEVGVVP